LDAQDRLLSCPAKHEVMADKRREQQQQRGRDDKKPSLIPPDADAGTGDCRQKAEKPEIGESIPTLGEVIPLGRKPIATGGVDC
jgi:hypothetical protein